MPETQFLFFTKWQEQKRRKFNIDPYMLIQKFKKLFYITEGLADHFALTDDCSDTPVNLIRR